MLSSGTAATTFQPLNSLEEDALLKQQIIPEFEYNISDDHHLWSWRKEEPATMMMTLTATTSSHTI